MYLLGYDIGSSSVKASIINVSTGTSAASAFSPKQEMEIIARRPGWAEQEPSMWWENLKNATREVLAKSNIRPSDILGIGISYQMHGLVLIDKDRKVIRPSIIWCDSRAVETGNRAFNALGENRCLSCLLNSPGNFTASKLRWVKENEPDHFKAIYKFMLPGDYIAMLLTGVISTTVSGLSEGIFWDFKANKLADFLLDHYGIPASMVPDILPTFSVQGKVTADAARELGLSEGIPVAYRAGDQPNNAFSLNVINPGEIAATAGTSGVVYGVSSEVKFDPQSRVNTFAHVNHELNNTRLGVLLCVNGTGILNSWLKHTLGGGTLNYTEMNEMAASVPPGSEGLVILPFGNGAERMLNNRDIGSRILNLNFNIHKRQHIFRAAQEGIVFSFNYGIDVMRQTGINPAVIRAGKANMFLSPLFREALACITGATIELYDTDGAQGAAKGAGVGMGFYKSFSECFAQLKKLDVIQPDPSKVQAYTNAYARWLDMLKYTADSL